MIKNQFGLDIPVFVLSREALEDILQMRPTGGAVRTKKSMII